VKGRFLCNTGSGVMRWLAVTFCFASLASADSLYLDDSWPDETRATLQQLSDDVWDIVSEMFQSSMPLDLPIRVRQSKAEVPVTRVFENEINIRITAHGTFYGQFAFQLGHELGHVMLDPRRTDGVVEAIAIAVSYEVLDRLDKKVKDSPAFPWLASYGKNFKPYRRDDQKIVLDKFPEEIRDLVAHKKWDQLSDYLRQHSQEMEAGHANDRDMQTLAAISLRSAPVDWSQFAGIAGCTTPSPNDDPTFKVLPVNPDCVSRSSDLFCRMGIGCNP
jgi:hypothetical protein